MSEKLTITGPVSVIGPVETFKNDFTKRVFVLELGSAKFPSPCPFELKKGNCDLLNGVTLNSKLKVDFYLDGREWANPKTGEVRYFLSANAVSVEVLEQAPGEVATGTFGQPSPDDSEIPF